MRLLPTFRRRAALPEPSATSPDDMLVAAWNADPTVRHLKVLHLPDTETDRQLAEVEAERDELRQALDERRPAPTREVLGAVLEQQWHKHSAAESTSTEAWSCVAEHAIDYVRGLWPVLRADDLPPLEPRDPDVIAWSEVADLAGLLFDAMQVDVGRYVSWDEMSADARRHFITRAQHLLRSGRVLVAPPPGRTEAPHTSPGAPGQQQPSPAADQARGLGSDTEAPGDTHCSAAHPTAAERPAPAEAPPAGSGGAAATPTPPAGSPLSADEREQFADEHLERLALRLAVTAGAVTSVTWNLMNESYREMYRVLATQVVLAGWLPPGTRSPAATRADVAAVIREHEWMADDTCRCGWDERACDAAPLFHAEHIAEHLIDAGVTA